MSFEDMIQMLHTIRKMAEVRELEPLVQLILAEARRLAGAKGGYLVFLESANLVSGFLRLGTDGTRLEGGNRSFFEAACEQAIRHREIQLFQKGNNDLGDFQLDGDSVLLLPLVGAKELRGGLVLQGPISFSGDQYKEVLRLFGENAAAHIETVLLVRKMDERIKYLAEHDTLLTTLLNRTAFKNKLIEAIGRATAAQLAVLFIDLDDFESVNRKFGHRAGDIVLFEVARRIAQFAIDQRLGEVPARMGGDEFALLLVEPGNPTIVREVATRLLAEISMQFALLGSSQHVNASIGISLYPGDGETSDDLLDRADRACYLAKTKDKNTYQFYSSVSSNV